MGEMQRKGKFMDVCMWPKGCVRQWAFEVAVKVIAAGVLFYFQMHL